MASDESVFIVFFADGGTGPIPVAAYRDRADAEAAMAPDEWVEELILL